MRNKPTIIAFKTPSLESCEQRPSQNSIGSMSKFFERLTEDFFFICFFTNISVVSPGLYTEKEAEEGRIFKRPNPNEAKGSRPVNYPVGKPLEVIVVIVSLL